MTIHADHPFRDPDDVVRRLRGRLGGAVTLWTSGGAGGAAPSAAPSATPRAGLTVSSLMVAGGEQGRVLALLDPDSDLHAALEATGRGVVHLLEREHRDLAEVFAGRLPAPGGRFASSVFEDSAYGPRLVTARSWAQVELESSAQVGWSALVTARLATVELGEESAPLEHRRGRYRS